MTNTAVQPQSIPRKSVHQPEIRLFWTGDIWGSTTLRMIALQEEETRQQIRLALERSPDNAYWQEKLDALGDPIELKEIRRIDEWRIEWGYAPYERAAQLFRDGFQGRTAPFPVKDIASVYKNMAAMAKEDTRSIRRG